MNPPIYLIPGLGADHRNFPSPWQELPNCNCLQWPEYHGGASMPEVARFMVAAWQLPPDAVLIGSSFGGMLACEISKILPVRALVLVGSTTTAKRFMATAKMKRLLRFIWLPSVQGLLRFSRPLLEKIWGRAPTPATRAVLDSIQMFAVCRPGFYRNMFQAISIWEGWEGGSAKLVQIHGRHDGIILPPANADLYLEGGHLICMTHAPECVSYIQSWLKEDVSSQDHSPGK